MTCVWPEMQTPGGQMAPGPAELQCAFFTDQVLPSQRIFTQKHLTNSEKWTMCPVSRSKFEGRLPEAFCRRGTGAAPASGGLTQPPTPGGTRATSPTTRSRPGPTTVKGIKAKMPRWRAARRGCTAVHHGPAAGWTSPGREPGTALCRRADPLDWGKESDSNEGEPLAQSMQTGADILSA